MAAVSQYLGRTACIVLLLLAWLLLLTTIDRRGLSPAEAASAYAVYDVRSAPAVSGIDDIRPLLRYLRDSLQTAIARTASQPLIERAYTLLLDGWTLVMGGGGSKNPAYSETILRLPAAFAGMLAMAAAYTTGQSLQRGAGLILAAGMIVAAFLLTDAAGALALVALVLLALAIAARWLPRLIIGLATSSIVIGTGALLWIHTTDTYYQPFTGRETVAEAAGFRMPLEPALIAVPGEHPLAYYSRRYGLTDGLVIDYGWQAFDADAIARVARAARAQPQSWLVGSPDNPATRQFITELRAGRRIGYQATIDNMIIYRFDEDSR